MLAILAAMMLAAAPQHDTVFTADGGRVIGTVVEEGPQGVSVQLVDGTLRRFARRDVVRVEYADGSVSTPRSAEPPPSPPRAAPPPAYAPAPPQQGYAPPPPPGYTPPPPPAYGPPAYPPRPPPAAWARPHTGPISPFYLALGVGGAALSGTAETGRDMDNVFAGQFALSFEGGARLSPHLALGLYANVGWGDAGSEIRNFCRDQGFDCDASTARFGVLLRHTFDPAARTTPWIAVGTGFERGTVNWTDNGEELLRYSGWEMLRLMGGVDFRSNPVVGIGVYAGLSFGRFGRYEDSAVSESLSDRTTHTTIEGGLRFTLFP